MIIINHDILSLLNLHNLGEKKFLSTKLTKMGLFRVEINRTQVLLYIIMGKGTRISKKQERLSFIGVEIIGYLNST